MCYDAIHKHSSRSTFIRLCFDKLAPSKLYSFKTTGSMHRRPSEGRHLLNNIRFCQILLIDHAMQHGVMNNEIFSSSNIAIEGY